MQNNNSKFQILYFTLLFLVFSFAFYVPLAQAATISFSSSDKAIINQELRVEMILETNNENVNALEGELVWPSDKLELVEVEDTFSIISLWIKDPKLIATTSQGHLPFSGLIPSGYGEPRGQILTLVFRPLASGSASLTLKDALVLLNDGRGTAASITTTPLDFRITSWNGFKPIWLYILSIIVGIIIVIIIWSIIRRKKYSAI